MAKLFYGYMVLWLFLLSQLYSHPTI